MNNSNVEDPRFSLIKSLQCYALYHGGDMIYVGWTRKTLTRRLQKHWMHSKQHDTPLYSYLQEAKKLNVTIRPLYGYEHEKEAIEAHADKDLLNKNEGETSKEYCGHHWTTEDLEYLKSHTLYETAEHTGASYNQCRQARKKLGWDDQRDTWSAYETEQLGTAPDKEVAESIGRSPAAVQSKRQSEGIESYNGANGRALSDEQAANLYLLYHLSDHTQAELAGLYDVSAATCSNVARGDYPFDTEPLDRLVDVVESAGVLDGFDHLDSKMQQLLRKRELLRSRILQSL